MKKIFYFFVCVILFISCKKEPVASFEVLGTTKVGETIRFINQSENSNKYFWDFGDGSSSTEESPSHVFAKPGNYNVSLNSVGDNGSASFAKSLIITGTTFSFKNKTNIDIPNFATFYWDGTEILDFYNHGLLLNEAETKILISTRSEVMFGFTAGSYVYIGTATYNLIPDRHNLFTLNVNTPIYSQKGTNTMLLKLSEKYFKTK